MRTANADNRQSVERLLDTQGITKRPGGRVAAYANHGRWVADCPCGGAELVGDGDMVCGSCGLVHEVDWPEDRKRIEGLLRVRPALNQNWLPGETVEMLAAENIDSGVFDIEGDL